MTSTQWAALERELDDLRAASEQLRSALGAVHLGYPRVIDELLWAFFAGGHVLLEGVPGLGKTTLVQGLADCLELEFARIQFTPDLMPGDILGTRILEENEAGQRRFRFHAGPVFANVVLADEINRATPRTQSALLEAMQDAQVTSFGETRALPQPFTVVATQNPIEMEGTYPLPEAQVDRFLFQISIEPPNRDQLVAVLERGTAESARATAVVDASAVARWRELAPQVPVSADMVELTAQTVLATRPDGDAAPELVRRNVRYGSSPRGGQSMLAAARVRALMRGELHVAREDLEAVCLPALRHRLILNYEGEAANVGRDELARAAWEAAVRGTTS